MSEDQLTAGPTPAERLIAEAVADAEGRGQRLRVGQDGALVLLDERSEAIPLPAHVLTDANESVPAQASPWNDVLRDLVDRGVNVGLLPFPTDDRSGVRLHEIVVDVRTDFTLRSEARDGRSVAEGTATVAASFEPASVAPAAPSRHRGRGRGG